MYFLINSFSSRKLNVFSVLFVWWTLVYDIQNIYTPLTSLKVNILKMYTRVEYTLPTVIDHSQSCNRSLSCVSVN